MGRSEDEEQLKRRKRSGVGREKEKNVKEKLEDIYSHGWYVTEFLTKSCIFANEWYSMTSDIYHSNRQLTF